MYVLVYHVDCLWAGERRSLNLNRLFYFDLNCYCLMCYYHHVQRQNVRCSYVHSYLKDWSGRISVCYL